MAPETGRLIRTSLVARERALSSLLAQQAPAALVPTGEQRALLELTPRAAVALAEPAPAVAGGIATRERNQPPEALTREIARTSQAGGVVELGSGAHSSPLSQRARFSGGTSRNAAKSEVAP